MAQFNALIRSQVKQHSKEDDLRLPHHLGFHLAGFVKESIHTSAPD